MLAPMWRTVVGTVLVQTAIYVARPLLTYRALDLGAGEAAVGALVVAFTFAPALIALPVGRYCDRASPTVMARLGVALLVVGAVALVLAPAFGWLLLAAAVLGVGSVATMIATQAQVARMVTGDRLEAGFGLLTTAVAIGQMVGPALGGVLVADTGRAGSTTTGFGATTLLFLAALAFLWLSPRGMRPPPEGRSVERSTSWALLRRPSMSAAIVASTAILASADLLIAYLPLIGERNGISPATVGLLLSARAAASVAVRLSIPVLVRHVAPRRLLVASLAVPGVVLGCLVLPLPVWALFVAMTVVGGFLGLGQPLTMSMLVRAAPAADHGAALSLRLTGTKVGQVTMAAAIAGVTGAASISAAFVVLGGSLLAAAGAVRISSRG